MRKRILVLPISALVIVLVCLYGMNRTNQQSTRRRELPTAKRPAPSFELYDQDNRIVRLGTYLGRHTIVLVFYDKRDGADRDPSLRKLRENSARLKQESVIILGLSTALPQENRKRIEERGKTEPDFELPFPLLTDIPPVCSVHRQWGRFDETVEISLQGVFHIDRAGNVDWAGRFPKPVSDVDQLLNSLITDR